MAEPFSLAAALVVASLCNPSSNAQSTGYYVVNNVQVVGPGIPPIFAGFGLPTSPFAEATVSYWRGVDAVRIYAFSGPLDQLHWVVQRKLPPPRRCNPIG